MVEQGAIIVVGTIAQFKYFEKFLFYPQHFNVKQSFLHERLSKHKNSFFFSLNLEDITEAC